MDVALLTHETGLRGSVGQRRRQPWESRDLGDDVTGDDVVVNDVTVDDLTVDTVTVDDVTVDDVMAGF